MSAKFVPHRCARTYISVGGKKMEVTESGYETFDEAEIAEIRSKAIFGTWLIECLPAEPEQTDILSQPADYAEPAPIPTIGGLDAADIVIEEAALAEQAAIREEQAKAELVQQEIGREIDEGVRSEMRKRTPGGKDPAGGKSKKKDAPKDDAPKKRGRPPKAK